MINSMRKKRDREASNEPELPLSEPSEERSVTEVEKGNTAASRYGRRHNPAVFEFEEVASKAVPELDLDGDANPPSVLPEPEAEVGDSEGSASSSASERLFEQAKAASRAGRLEEALDSYRRLVAMDPAHIRARNNLGVLLDQMGGHDVALEHFQAAVEIDPENAEVLTNFGASLAAQGRYDEAESQLRKAARLDPEGIDVRANLGILYFRRGLYAQANVASRIMSSTRFVTAIRITSSHTSTAANHSTDSAGSTTPSRCSNVLRTSSPTGLACTTSWESCTTRKT